MYNQNEILKFHHDSDKSRGFILGKFLRTEEFYGVEYAIYEAIADYGRGDKIYPMNGQIMRCPMNGTPTMFGELTDAIERA